MAHSETRMKIIALQLLGMGTLAALPAHATLVDNNLLAEASAQPGTSLAVTVGPQTNPTYVSQSVYEADGVGNSSDGSAWGNQYGTYRASAGGSGTFSSSGHFHRTLTLTNDNGYATDYSLSFFIYYGSLSASTYDGVVGSGYAQYDLEILLNNSSTLFASMARLNSDGTMSKSGTELDGALQSGDYYYWSGTTVNLNLGTLGVGQSLTVDFDLVSTAFGDFGFSESGCYGGYGNEVATFAGVGDGYGGYGGCTGSVYASLGDPGDFEENGQNNPSVVITGQRTPTDLPLPGTLALTALGLAGLGWSRRRPRN